MTSNSNLGLYLVGFIIVIIGLAWGASLLGVPVQWIAVGVIVLLGIGILSAVKKTQVPRSTGTTNTPGNPPRY
jgi:hypothetical protein